MHDPREPHLSALKRILRYLQGTLDLGLHLHRTSPADLTVYTDADWAGCPDTRKSTSGYVAFLGDNLISWSSKCQPTVFTEFRSSLNVRGAPSSDCGGVLECNMACGPA